MASLSSTTTTSSTVKNSLIEADGGVLVNLVVPERLRGDKIKEAQTMPKLQISTIDLQWVHVISEGWASPLKGFMREDEYLQSLHFNSLRIKNGGVVNMSLRIVMAIDDEAKNRIGAFKDVAIYAPDGNMTAILRRYWKIKFLILPETTIVSIFPSPMLYAGPTEVQWHAKAQINAGANFYVVSRDPAGMSHPTEKRDLYDPDHGKKVLSMAPGLEKLNILPFRVAAYDTIAKKMAFFYHTRKQDFLFISGTKMRTHGRNGWKGNVVIDAFRVINPQTMMLGQEPRQTTSNLGHLNKPSIQALIHGLNRHYYSIATNYRKNELEEKMLLNLHKKKRTDDLTLQRFDTHSKTNEQTLQEMVGLAIKYNKAVQEEDELTPEKLVIANVGRQDVKKHLEEHVSNLMSSNINQTLGTMIDTVVF